jgi:hypothetical protein
MLESTSESRASGDRTSARRTTRTTSREFLRGALASMCSIVTTFPLNKLASRQAYEGLRVSEALSTLRFEGLRALYRGVSPPLLSKALSASFMYGGYDFFYHALARAVTGVSDSRPATEVPLGESLWWVRTAAAILAGSVEGLLAPFERIQTILQHRHYSHEFAHSWDVLKRLCSFGPGELYRGFSCILLRNGPANAVFFSFRDPVRDLLPPPVPGSPTAAAQDFGRDFVSGALLGAGISTLFFPMNPVKAAMQLQIGGPFRSLAAVWQEVATERGISGLYRGVGVNAARSLIGWGIVNGAYGLSGKLI